MSPIPTLAGEIDSARWRLYLAENAGTEEDRRHALRSLVRGLAAAYLPRSGAGFGLVGALDRYVREGDLDEQQLRVLVAALEGGTDEVE